MSTLITQHDYDLLLKMQNIANALNDQIDELTEAVGLLVGVRANDDAVTDLILNRGKIDSFLKDLDLVLVKNRNAQ